MALAVRRLVPGVWLGLLLGVALLATPAPFAVLDKPLAGKVVGWIFEREAITSCALAALVFLMERRRALDAWQAGTATTQFNGAMVAALLALFCTLVGYYGLQPMMAQAKGGAPTPLSFGQLHAISFGLFGVKILAVAALAWGAAAPPTPASR